MANLLPRLTAKGRRELAARFRRRPARLGGAGPMVSFTFDDAPASAFDVGGEILRAQGAAGTYFVSLGLAGLTTEVGRIADAEQMLQALGEGHELGCHTHDHLDAWFSSRAEYLASVRRNAEAWAKLAPAAEFATFAYPKSGPTVWVKGDLSERFLACRGGGQCGNEGTVDLNLVQACFLDGRTRIQMDQVRMLIDRNASSSGWLVFATHDVADDPSPYGCKLGFFERVVEYAVQSGAAILPFGTAAKALLP